MKNGMMTQLTHMGSKIEMPDASLPKVPPPAHERGVLLRQRRGPGRGQPGRAEDYLYGRTSNPTNDCLREILTAIEGGESSQVYSSGMGAISMAVMSHIKAGDHIIVNKIIFGTSFKFFRAELRDKFGVEISFVDFQNEDIEAHYRPNTKMVYMETIANPTCDVIDIRRIAKSAHAHGCLLIVDNTFATPSVCKPISLGADMVVYSATKFLCGHSDILAGVIVANRKSPDRHHHRRRPLLRSDHEPLRRLAADPAACAPWTSGWPALPERHGRRRVLPGPPEGGPHPLQRPGHLPRPRVASETFQPGRFGGMVSIDLGSEQAVNDVIRNFKMVKLVPSLGAFLHHRQRHQDLHGAMTRPSATSPGSPTGILRISIGLEDVDDIIADFDQALKVIQ